MPNRPASRRRPFFFAAATLSLVACTFGQEGTLRVQVDQPGVRISPSLYGIFFEEINNAGDGGLYAELLRNRSFEETGANVPNWSPMLAPGASGSVTVNGDDAGNEGGADGRDGFNKHFLTIRADAVAKPGDGATSPSVGVANDGYWGVSVRKGGVYRVMLRARSRDVTKLTVSLQNRAGVVYGSTDVNPQWSAAGTFQQWAFNIPSDATDPSARLVLGIDQPGSVDVDYVSLMPTLDAADAKPAGMTPTNYRQDLFDKLHALKPAFMRFPGGCWVEGDTMATASRWKRTIGAPWERWTQPNLWGYQSPNGLGYHEYLQLCEELKCSALFVVNVGMSHHGNVPMAQMGEYVQDALDAIEYATGPADSTWGKKRAEAGHPAPFDLKYVEIGNENGGPAYNERYALYYDAIKKAYPQVRTVACLWNGRPNSRPIDLLDEHYYKTPRWFFRNAGQYDKYDRNGPKVYVGEYAVTQGCGNGNLIAALGEAAFMTGMERNSDVVSMASYAPLFTQVNGRRWNPNLINFDNARSYGTPSYHVQQMFSTNRGDVVLPVTLAAGKADAPAPDAKLAGRAGVGTWGTQAEYKDFEVVAGDKVVYRAADAKGGDAKGGDAKPQGWTFVGKGLWETSADGSLAQGSDVTDVQAIAGDPAWTDYSVRVKARKTGGKEGFIVVARYQGEGDYVWFNVGGWDNTATAIERNRDGDKAEIGPRADLKVEPNRWYDLRLDVKGDDVTAYVDGKQVAAAKDAAPGNVTMLAATASRDDASGDVILKVVNGNPTPQSIKVSLEGLKTVGSTARAIVLTGKPGDENTLDAPMNVAPRTSEVSVAGPTFTHEFPACSATILRIPTR